MMSTQPKYELKITLRTSEMSTFLLQKEVQSLIKKTVGHETKMC